jgi:ABC-2 type transport system permease protein
MKSFADMFWVEMLKTIRSRVPLLVTLGFLILPLAVALLIFIYKDPALAHKMGILSTKANIAVTSADWPAYMKLILESTAAGGFFFYCILISWIFGREFPDHTLKDLLAVPVPRQTILLAKFLAAGVWSAGLTVELYAVCLIAGSLIQLPLGSTGFFLRSSLQVALTAAMTVCVVLPFALFASIGRGYLLPVGIAILSAIVANLLAVTGWAEYFPLGVPALYSQGTPLSAISYIIVVLTGLTGIAATYLWWRYADQNR